jgi:prepilin peptidase CpaA
MLASITDLRSRRIPNWLVLPFLGAGIVASAVGFGWSGFERSLGGIALAVVIMGGPVWLHGIGMGDLKLCAAVGAWIWPAQMVIALIAMGIAGGAMALAWAAFHGSVGESLDGVNELISGFRRREGPHYRRPTLGSPTALKLPYAPAIAIGAVFSFYSV